MSVDKVYVKLVIIYMYRGGNSSLLRNAVSFIFSKSFYYYCTCLSAIGAYYS